MWPIVICLLLLTKAAAIPANIRSCRHIIHFHFPSTEKYTELVTSIAPVQITTPAVTFIHTIPNDPQVSAYWDPKAVCVVHLVISEYRHVVQKSTRVSSQTSKNELTEYEYYYGFGIMTENDEPKDIYRREYTICDTEIRQASKYLQNLAFVAINLTTEPNSVVHVQQVTFLRRYCTPNHIYCLQRAEDGILEILPPEATPLVKASFVMHQQNDKSLHFNGQPIRFAASSTSLLELVNLTQEVKSFVTQKRMRGCNVPERKRELLLTSSTSAVYGNCFASQCHSLGII